MKKKAGEQTEAARRIVGFSSRYSSKAPRSDAVRRWLDPVNIGLDRFRVSQLAFGTLVIAD